MPGFALRAALTCSSLVLMLTLNTFASAQETPAPSDARAEADDQEARGLFKLGKQAFDEGRYEHALKYFQDAYDLSHRAALLSNIGTVLDRLRRDQEALDAYKSYLEQVPDAPNRALIEERVHIIEGALAKPEQPSTDATPPTAAPPPSAPPSPPVVPTPAQTAQAAPAVQPKPAELPAAVSGTTAPRPEPESSALTSRWWFWAGIGAVAAAAVVVGVAASSGGSVRAESPALSNADTRVREL